MEDFKIICVCETEEYDANDDKTIIEIDIFGTVVTRDYRFNKINGYDERTFLDTLYHKCIVAVLITYH